MTKVIIINTQRREPDITGWKISRTQNRINKTKIHKFFPYFYDSGYAFAKMLGLSLTSYTLFLLGVLHVLPFSQADSWLIVILWLVILNTKLALKESKLKIAKDLLIHLKTKWQIILFEEAIFLLGLTAWSYIRGNNPDIHGLEKFNS